MSSTGAHRRCSARLGLPLLLLCLSFLAISHAESPKSFVRFIMGFRHPEDVSYELFTSFIPTQRQNSEFPANTPRVVASDWGTNNMIFKDFSPKYFEVDPGMYRFDLLPRNNMPGPSFKCEFCNPDTTTCPPPKVGCKDFLQPGKYYTYAFVDDGGVITLKRFGPFSPAAPASQADCMLRFINLHSQAAAVDVTYDGVSLVPGLLRFDVGEIPDTRPHGFQKVRASTYNFQVNRQGFNFPKTRWNFPGNTFGNQQIEIIIFDDAFDNVNERPDLTGRDAVIKSALVKDFAPGWLYFDHTVVGGDEVAMNIFVSMDFGPLNMIIQNLQAGVRNRRQVTAGLYYFRCVLVAGRHTVAQSGNIRVEPGKIYRFMFTRPFPAPLPSTPFEIHQVGTVGYLFNDARLSLDTALVRFVNFERNITGPVEVTMRGFRYDKVLRHTFFWVDQDIKLLTRVPPLNSDFMAELPGPGEYAVVGAGTWQVSVRRLSEEDPFIVQNRTYEAFSQNDLFIRERVIDIDVIANYYPAYIKIVNGLDVPVRVEVVSYFNNQRRVQLVDSLSPKAITPFLKQAHGQAYFSVWTAIPGQPSYKLVDTPYTNLLPSKYYTAGVIRRPKSSAYDFSLLPASDPFTTSSYRPRTFFYSSVRFCNFASGMPTAKVQATARADNTVNVLPNQPGLGNATQFLPFMKGAYVFAAINQTTDTVQFDVAYTLFGNRSVEVYVFDDRIVVEMLQDYVTALVRAVNGIESNNGMSNITVELSYEGGPLLPLATSLAYKELRPLSNWLPGNYRIFVTWTWDFGNGPTKARTFLRVGKLTLGPEQMWTIAVVNSRYNKDSVDDSSWGVTAFGPYYPVHQPTHSKSFWIRVLSLDNSDPRTTSVDVYTEETNPIAKSLKFRRGSPPVAYGETAIVPQDLAYEQFAVKYEEAHEGLLSVSVFNAGAAISSRPITEVPLSAEGQSMYDVCYFNDKTARYVEGPNFVHAYLRVVHAIEGNMQLLVEISPHAREPYQVIHEAEYPNGLQFSNITEQFLLLPGVKVITIREKVSKQVLFSTPPLDIVSRGYYTFSIIEADGTPTFTLKSPYGTERPSSRTNTRIMFTNLNQKFRSLDIYFDGNMFYRNISMFETAPLSFKEAKSGRRIINFVEAERTPINAFLGSAVDLMPFAEQEIVLFPDRTMQLVTVRSYGYIQPALVDEHTVSAAPVGRVPGLGLAGFFVLVGVLAAAI